MKNLTSEQIELLQQIAEDNIAVEEAPLETLNELLALELAYFGEGGSVTVTVEGERVYRFGR